MEAHNVAQAFPKSCSSFYVCKLLSESSIDAQRAHTHTHTQSPGLAAPSLHPQGWVAVLIIHPIQQAQEAGCSHEGIHFFVCASQKASPTGPVRWAPCHIHTWPLHRGFYSAQSPFPGCIFCFYSLHHPLPMCLCLPLPPPTHVHGGLRSPPTTPREKGQGLPRETSVCWYQLCVRISHYSGSCPPRVPTLSPFQTVVSIVTGQPSGPTAVPPGPVY